LFAELPVRQQYWVSTRGCLSAVDNYIVGVTVKTNQPACLSPLLLRVCSCGLGATQRVLLSIQNEVGHAQPQRKKHAYIGSVESVYV